MVFCGECGAANENGSTVCYECGAVLPVTQVVKKKAGIPKPLLIAGGALLAVLLVVGVVLLCLSGGQRDLTEAFDQTMTAFQGNETGTQAQTFVQKLDDLLKDGDYAMALRTSGDSGIFLTTEYSRDNEVMRGAIGLMGMELDYSIDSQAIQFSIPGQFDNVYGVKLKQLDRLANNPLLSVLMGDLGKRVDLNADFFAKNDLETTFRNIAGEEYDALRKSVKIKELDEKVLNGQNCQVYEISWSSSAMVELVAALGSMGTMPELGGLVTSLIPDLGSDCRCYIGEDGYIAGVEFSSAGAQCLFLLEGRENPWDAFRLTIESIYGETVVYTGGLEHSGTKMRFTLANDTDVLLSLYYDDATGEFSLATKDKGAFLSGCFRTQGELCLSLEWDAADLGTYQMEFSIAALDRKPSPMANHYIDLLDMSMSDLTRLLLDLGIQIG